MKKLVSFKANLAVLSLLAPLMVFTTQAQAYSHAYIDSTRSSTETHVYVTEGADAEYGRLHTNSDNKDYPVSQDWRGFGLRTAVGLEVMKFIQFDVAHTFVNMSSQNDSLEKMSGSRLTGGGRLVFSAPIGNLELGGGIIGSNLDYQKELLTATYSGSGIYYSLGLNYFMTSRVSMYGDATVIQENFVKTGGVAPVENMQSNMTAMGFGFNLWL